MLNIIWATIAAFFPLYALQHGLINPGIFFFFLAITLMLGRLLGGRLLDIYDRRKVIMLCLTLILIALVIFPLARSHGMFILIAVLLGAGWTLLYPILTVHVIENTGLQRGPAMATFTAIADLGSGLGPMVMGLVLEKTGYTIMFVCLIFTAVINLLYFYWAVVKKERLVSTSLNKRTP